jgi:hypothetical protein
MNEQSWQEVFDYANTSDSETNHLTPMDMLSISSNATSPLAKKKIYSAKNCAQSVFAVQALENQSANQPIENKTLMIRTRKEPHLYLSLCYGDLKLQLSPGSGSFWLCVKRGGWYGFRNTVSGTYLCRGLTTIGTDTICMGSRSHAPSEYFYDR